jgi:hypothetical protein
MERRRPAPALFFGLFGYFLIDEIFRLATTERRAGADARAPNVYFAVPLFPFFAE